MTFQPRLRTAALAAAAAASCLASALAAQQALPIDPPLAFPGTSYAASVPAPEVVLGVRVGQRHARPDELVTYARLVASAAPDRVRVQEHGRTVEGRPLVHAIVTSPANMARLDEIRRANLRLSDDPAGATDAMLGTMPVVVYLGYSVHGNEASGSDASLLVLYHLAAGRGPAVDSLLERAVVIIEPSINPDGRSRFVDWVTWNRGAVPTSDPADREHVEPWPGGRFNHWLADPNRDWLPAQFPEAQARLRLYHDWRPHVLADLHEMGSDQTYFFQPGVPSRVNPNTPERTFQLTAELAQYHARALDRIGSLYFTKQQYDDFYYGKGSTYPDINGAVGILFEQASSRALLRETAFGPLAYGFTVRNQVVGSLTTVEGAVAMREKLLRHQRDFYREALQPAAKAPQGWLLPLTGDASRARALVELLQRHRVRVHALAKAVTVGAETFRPGEAVAIPAAQPQRRLLTAAMERVSQYRDSVFYDISTWTLPLAFGVRSAEAPLLPGDALGAEVRPEALDGPRLAGAPARVAYALEPQRAGLPRAVVRLLAAGVIPLVSREPFTAVAAGERRTFARGTVLVPVTGRATDAPPADSVHALVRRLVEEERLLASGLDAGLAADGPDLGGLSSIPLQPVRAAIVAGEGQPATEVGEAWHLLTVRAGLDASLLEASRLSAATLPRYTALLLTGALPGGRDGAARQALDAWVRAGGTLVATGAGARWAIEAGIAEEKVKPLPADSLRRGFADAREFSAAQELAGAILEANADPTHPIAFGLDAKLPVFRDDTLAFEPSKQPGANVLVLGAEPRLSGWVPARAMAALKQSAALIARRSGRGRVVLVADNPDFRAFWRGTERLLLNAVLLAPAY
ncbi:MAG: M14 family metallopeptidase [Gemmatimonadales bacterium]|nr:M14 family metallopeptidase [Gemmatimonadales bacterium]